MREDLKAACRPLGLGQRFWWWQQLKKVESLLGPPETVQVLVPVWWRGRRNLAVVTTFRLLLVGAELKQSSSHQGVFALQSISQLSVYAAPPDSARFRLKLGLDLEEFTVTQRGAEFERALRAALP